MASDLVDPDALAGLRAELIRIRDEAATAINRLDENPPISQEDYLAEKTRLIAFFRDISITASRVPGGQGA